MLRMFPASVTSDDRVRKAGLLRAENTDLHFIPVFVCIYAAKSGIFLTGGKHSFPLCPLSLCLRPWPVGLIPPRKRPDVQRSLKGTLSLG
ncbi:hypothetical protein BEI64_22850 [Eisenbergiella tayi]|nr:hypothetical protein BEI64_22850 [Eisenbergiella tayi]